MTRIRGRRAATEILESDNAHVVRPPLPTGPLDEMIGRMARFNEGPRHAELRGLVVDVISSLDADQLQRRAEAVAGTGVEPSTVPLAVLCEALDIAPVGSVENGSIVTAMVDIRRAVSPEGQADPGANGAVARVLAAAGARGGSEDETVARVSVLFQAGDATAGLINDALGVGLDPDPAARIAATIETSPIVGHTLRRIDGEVVEVDLTDGLAFGAGRHACPGEQIARSLATGAFAGSMRARM